MYLNCKSIQQYCPSEYKRKRETPILVIAKFITIYICHKQILFDYLTFPSSHYNSLLIFSAVFLVPISLDAPFKKLLY